MKKPLAAFSAIAGIGYMGYIVLPLALVGVMEHYAINDATAGGMATCLLGGLAVGLFACTHLLRRHGPRKLCLLGAALAVFAYATCAFAPPLALLGLSLLVGGLGMGLCMGGGEAIVASMPDPDRAFAGVYAAGQLAGILLLALVLPWAMAQGSMAGAFAALAIWSLLNGLLLLATLGDGQAAPATEKSPGFRWIYFVSPAVLALFLLGLADASVWPFSPQIGQRLGLDEGQAGLVLASALAAGVAGSVLAAVISTRWGRK